MDPVTAVLLLTAVAGTVVGAQQQEKALQAQRGAQRETRMRETARMKDTIQKNQMEADALKAQQDAKTRNSPTTSNGLDVGAATVVGSSGTF